MQFPKAGLSLLVAAVLHGSLAGGCSSYRPPTLEIREGFLRDRTEEAVQLGFTLDLSNPNSEPIKLLQIDYELVIDGKSLYRGRRSAEATLNSLGTRRLVIPAVVRFDQITRPEPRLEVPYDLRGTILYLTPDEIAEILLDTGVRKPRVGFSVSGIIRTDEQRTDEPAPDAVEGIEPVPEPVPIPMPSE